MRSLRTILQRDCPDYERLKQRPGRPKNANRRDYCDVCTGTRGRESARSGLEVNPQPAFYLFVEIAFESLGRTFGRNLSEIEHVDMV